MSDDKGSSYSTKTAWYLAAWHKKNRDIDPRPFGVIHELERQANLSQDEGAAE